MRWNCDIRCMGKSWVYPVPRMEKNSKELRGEDQKTDREQKEEVESKKDKHIVRGRCKEEPQLKMAFQLFLI